MSLIENRENIMHISVDLTVQTGLGWVGKILQPTYTMGYSINVIT